MGRPVREGSPSAMESRALQMPFDDLFVLELANNHWGRLDRGLKIVRDFADVVEANGVRAAVKLQFRDVDRFIHKDFRHRGDIRYIKKTLDTHLSWARLGMLVGAVRQAGLVTMATPFDEASVDRCVDFGVEIVKIASSDIGDWPLLEKIAATGKPVIASGGGASLEDLDGLVGFFQRHGAPFALNHCVSIYPSEDDELDLNQIDFLRSRYPGVTIGLSTHEHRDCAAVGGHRLRQGRANLRAPHRHRGGGRPGQPLLHPARAGGRMVQGLAHGPGDVRRRVGGQAAPPEKEVRYLDALVRGVYARRDLPAGHVLSFEDIYFAVPLQQGQISGREFVGGERLDRAAAARRARGPQHDRRGLCPRRTCGAHPRAGAGEG